MNNAVIYARYSSYSQTEQSIEGQIHVCQEFAKRNGYNVIDIYVDRAMSGTKDNRPAFQKMIEDAKSGTFQFIIVYKLDRFSRSKYDNVIYKHLLAQYGVKVISATECISDTPEGMLMEGLLEMFAEMYSMELSQKVKRGIKESLAKKNFIGGHIPYGFKVVDNKLVVNEEQARAIRYIFTEYAKGMSKVEIVKNLNEMGYRTNSGKKFTVNSFQHTLSNTKYIGEVTINGERYENYCPALIDVDTFNVVQEKLKENKHYSARRKADEIFLLTGKAFCGMCGASVVGISGTSHTKQRHSYYVCSNRYKHKTCKKQYEKKGYLEWYIVSQIKEYLSDEQTRKDVALNLYKAYLEQDIQKQIDEYDNRIKSVDKEIDSFCDKIIKVKRIEVMRKYEARVDELAELKEDLKAEYNKLLIRARLTRTQEDIENSLKLLIRGDELGIDYQKRIIDAFVDKVYIFDDKFIMYFNLLNVKQVSYVEMLEDVEEIEKLDKNNAEFVFHSLWRSNRDVNRIG